MVKPNSVLSITLLGIGNKPQGHWFVDGTVDYSFSPFLLDILYQIIQPFVKQFFITKSRVVLLLPQLKNAYETFRDTDLPPAATIVVFTSAEV